jgi:hypothetical protein
MFYKLFSRKSVFVVSKGNLGVSILLFLTKSFSTLIISLLKDLAYSIFSSIFSISLIFLFNTFSLFIFLRKSEILIFNISILSI